MGKRKAKVSKTQAEADPQVEDESLSLSMNNASDIDVSQTEESNAAPTPEAFVKDIKAIPEDDRDFTTMTDEQLLGLHRTGDEAAFQALVERYRRELFNFLARFSGSKAAADDLFQEAFLQVYISADTFDLSKRFKPWLFTIAANKARDLLRKNKRRKTLPLSASVGGAGGDDDGRTFIDLMEADVPIPPENAETAETADLVREIVQEMPDHLREVLLLAYFNRLAYKEIAEQVNVPLGTVKSRLHAAVGTFAELWKARYGETFDFG